MNRIHLLASWVAALALMAGANRVAWGEIWRDPEPPLTWDEMLACELVVLAGYESHGGGELKLRIAGVLKGDATQGSSITVKLEHLYSVETGPTGWDSFGKKDAPPDGIPKLCYKQQIMNPGGLVPLPVLADAREPALYFFPKAAAPALKRPQQVQTPLLLTGWRQALRGQPADLLFRLTQSVSSQIARDALEELGVSRDRACIEQLFEWIVNRVPHWPNRRFEPISLLARLGDRQGDVYDRATKLLRDAAPGKDEYRFWALARIMACADSDRAGRDLPELLATDRPASIRQAALAGLARVPTREAAEHALRSLHDPDASEAAIGTIHSLLGRADNYYDLPPFRGLNDEEWLLAKLRTTLADDRLPEKTKQQIRSRMGSLELESVELDLKLLRERLLDPHDKIYRGMHDDKVVAVLRQSRASCDLRVLPLLVEALAVVPAASGNQSYTVPESLLYFATICPRATRRELENRDLPAKLARIESWNMTYQVRNALEAAGAWQPRVDRVPSEVEECSRLAERVRRGELDQAAALIAAVEACVTRDEWSYVGRCSVRALLLSQSPAAESRFLKFLADARKVRTYKWWHEPRIGVELESLLGSLYAERPAIYLDRILELLRSPSLLERRAAADSLRSTLRCDFDLDAHALAADRARQLADKEPLIRLVVLAGEPQARVRLLAQAGVKLDGEPSDAWLEPLAKAVGSSDAAAPHALALIEHILGERRCLQFAHYPRGQRGRAIEAYLADAGHPVAK